MRFSINGKEYRKKTKFEKSEENLKYANEVYLPLKIAEIKAKLKSGELNLEVVNKKTFEYYSELFIKGKRGLKPNSIKQYENQIRFWNSHFAKRNIDSIKPSEIKEILFNKDVQVGTLKDLLAICKAVFDEALMDDELKENKARKIKLPRKQKRDIHPFSAEEVKRILDGSSGFFQCYLAIGFYTGIRTGELLALKWQNIDFKGKRIFINRTVGNYKEQTTKTGASVRYVPIFDALLPYLEEYKKKCGLNTYLFVTGGGGHYSSSNLNIYQWKPLLKRVGIPHRRMYETRHTFATNMIASNVFTLNQVAKWMGHSTIETLVKTYNNYIDSEVAKFDSKTDVFSTTISTVVSNSA